MDFVEHIRIQAEAMRAAAVTAGPQAPVPTCPEWTVHDLVTHQARIHSWATVALRTAPDAEWPKWEQSPESWDELLAWWDERVRNFVQLLRDTPPDTPVWTFNDERVASFWARRQAHETAIHRLDAEHAASHDVPALLFGSAFAADGIDEFLIRIQPRQLRRRKIEVTGRLLLHAADAGRAWELRLQAGEPVEVGPVTDSATHEDCTVAGTADAVYRAVWNRPSHAIVSGDRALLDGLLRP